MIQQRLSAFRAHLDELGLDGAVIRRPSNVFYLTGYPARLDLPSFAVVGPERVVLVAPGNAEAVGAQLQPPLPGFGYGTPGGTLDVVPDVLGGSVEALRQAVRAAGLAGGRVGIEAADVSARHAQAVIELATVDPLDEHLAALRRIKDSDELRLIGAAVGANDLGFAAAVSAIRAGATEFEVMNAVVAAMQRATGEVIDVLDPTDAILSGPRTLLIAAMPTSRRLESGDLVILDLNPYVGQYKGDTTRTFCLGEPTREQERVHAALVRGLEAAEQVARPGATGAQVFAALTQPIIAAGFGPLRTHGGHCIGLEHTERPFIIPGEDMRLKEGMVFALEPGVYRPEIGGLRVEDNYVLTADGPKALSHYPRRITVC